LILVTIPFAKGISPVYIPVERRKFLEYLTLSPHLIILSFLLKGAVLSGLPPTRFRRAREVSQISRGLSTIIFKRGENF
jgi:hypothetical protein